MSRCAHGTSPDEVLQEQRGGDGAAGRRRRCRRRRPWRPASPRSRRRAGTATTARRRPRRPRASAAARASSLAKSPPTCWPSATLMRTGQGRDVDDDAGLELGHGVGQRVGHHQAPLGVGVGDLGGATAVVAQHVAGAHGAAGDGVLGGGDEPDHPHRAVRRRPGRPSSPSRRRRRSCRASWSTMPGAGLIERPPESKVMPLPTRTTVGVLRAGLGRRVVEADQAGRGGRGLADADDAAEALGGQLLLVPDAEVEARLAAATSLACSASQAGFLRFEGTVASIRARQPAPPRATARSSTARSAASERAGSPRATTRATGACSGGRRAPVEARRSPASCRRRRPRARATGSSAGDRGGDRARGP